MIESSAVSEAKTAEPSQMKSGESIDTTKDLLKVPGGDLSIASQFHISRATNLRKAETTTTGQPKQSTSPPK